MSVLRGHRCGRYILSVVLVLVPAARAQPLYSNASPDASVPALAAARTSRSGVTAPNGWSFSEAAASGAESIAVGGFSGHAGGSSGQFRFADDVTVVDATWDVAALTVYAYQTGATSPPFSGLNVRVWDGPPNQPGSRVVWGDTTTNRLISCEFAGVCRVFSTTTTPMPAIPDTARRIWACTASLAGLHLTPGTFFLDWQFVSASPTGTAFAPPATVPGYRTLAGWNALQFRGPSGGRPAGWFPLLDGGKPASAADVPQDLPFLLTGVAVPSCDPDMDANGVADQDDIHYLVNVIGGGDNPTGINPDFDRNGVADQDDVVRLIDAVAGGGCG